MPSAGHGASFCNTGKFGGSRPGTRTLRISERMKLCRA